jgi:phage shock protein B
MDNLVPILVPLGGMVLLYFIIRMKHDRKLREMNLQGLSQEEQRALADMGEMARRMEQRIENLERILDSEVAGWRSRVPH